MKKIIYSDLDGTLLDYNERGSFVSDENISAITKWTRNNFFGIASGRNILSIGKLFANTKINFNLPFVLTNGALVYDFKKDKIIYQEPIAKDVIDEAIEYIRKKPIAILILVAARSRYYVGKFSDENRPSFEVEEITKTEINYNEILKIDFLVKAEYNEELTNDIRKFRTIHLASIVPSSIRYVELVSNKVSKHTGILNALKYADIKKYQLYSIGDYLNDYDMLLKSDLSFAPNNASIEIKSIVNHVVNSNQKHAIAEMISIVNQFELSKE